jgi:membrane protein DedA with SNARE-associated domain
VRKPLVILLRALLLCGILCLGPGELAAQPATQPAQTALGEASQFADAEFDKALAEARDLLNRYGYAAVFAAIFVEGMGIPGPGEMLMLAGTLDAAKGSLNIVLLLSLALAAAVIGNSVGYLIGRAGGRPLLRRLPISEARLARVAALFERYGGWVLLFARFIDGPRQLNGIIAGMLAMPWWRFQFWNLLGGLLWVGIWGLGSYWLDRDIDRVLAIARRIEPVLIALAAAALLAGLVYLWRRRGDPGK